MMTVMKSRKYSQNCMLKRSKMFDLFFRDMTRQIVAAEAEVLLLFFHLLMLFVLLGE